MAAVLERRKRPAEKFKADCLDSTYAELFFAALGGRY